VGHDPHFHQSLDAELGGLGLLLAERAGLEDVGEGDEHDRALALLEGELAAGLEVKPILVVPDGAADLDEHDVRLALAGQLAELELDLADDVGDDLHVAPEVAALALLFQHGREDLAVRGEVGGGEVLVKQALVGTKVHVGLHAVVQHEDFAVAVGVEGAGVDVEVALHLDRRHLQPLVLEQLGQTRREDPLAQAAHDGADHDDVLVVAPPVARGHGGVELGLFRALADAGQQVLIAHGGPGNV
jgi:hypothetical protein